MKRVSGIGRRELLARAGGFFLAAMGLGATRAVAGPITIGAGGVLELTGAQWRHISAEDERDDAHGSRMTLSGVLFSAGGAQVGLFRGTSYYFDGAYAGGARNSCLEIHTFALKDGTITGSGVSTNNASTFAITGGTGSFAGARGSYEARQSPLELGGDGTAGFKFTFL